MKRLLKFASFALAAVVLLFVAMIIAVTLVFEPNDYRPLVIKAVEDASGRSFTIDGDLGLKLLPCCGVSIGRATLGNPPGFPERPMISIDSAVVSVKIWPLLTQRELQIGTITLNGLDAQLQTLADGRNNWDFESAEPDDSAAADSDSPISTLTIEGLELRDANVSYSDSGSGSAYAARNINLATGSLAGTAPVPIALSLQLSDAGSGTDATVELVTTAQLLEQRLLLNDSAVSISAAGAQVPDNLAEIDITAGSISYDFPSAAPSAVAVDDLTLRVDQTRATGRVSIPDLSRGAVELDLQVDALDLDRYSSATPESAPATAGPTEIPIAALADLPLLADIRLGRLRSSGLELTDLQIELDNRPGAFDLSLSGAMAGGRIQLTGSGNPAAAAPALSGRLEITDLVLRQILLALDDGFATADPAALTKLDGGAAWRLQPRAFELRDMRWQLDATRIGGNLRLDDFDRAAMVFDLNLDSIDLDRYLAPEEESESAASAEAEIPADLIRDLTVSGRLSAGALKVSALSLQNLAAEVNAADGVLQLDPLTAQLYGGTYKGSIRIDASGATPRLTLAQQLSAVQISELLSALVDSDRLAGSLSLQLNGSGTGQTQTELLKALSGNFQFDLADGVYRGMDIAYEIQNAKALFNRAAPPQAPDRRETPIRALGLSGNIIEGVLRSEDLRAELPHLILAGAGGVNLIERTLDYKLNAEVLKSAANTADSKWQSLAGNTIPLTIKGPMSRPSVGVDLQGLVVTTVKERARDLLLKKLGGSETDSAPQGADTAPDDAAPASETAEDADTAPETPAQQAEPTPEDLLKQGLRNLFRKPDQ